MQKADLNTKIVQGKHIPIAQQLFTVQIMHPPAFGACFILNIALSVLFVPILYIYLSQHMFSSVCVIFYHIYCIINQRRAAAKQKLEYSCDRLEYSVHDKRIQ